MKEVTNQSLFVQGQKQGTDLDFGHTTLANLDPDSSYLYVHITIAFLLFPIAIFIMRRYLNIQTLIACILSPMAIFMM